MPKLEFFYDCSSPWTYLGFTGIIPIANSLGVDIQWRPHLVGGVFNAVNPELYEVREKAFSDKVRITRMMKDLQDWAAYRGIVIDWPSYHLQVNSVKMMRGCLVAQELGFVEAFSERLFRSYWSENDDVSGAERLAEVAVEVGMDGAAFSELLVSDPIKQRLKENTDELIERGGYGSPTMFINDDDMYFGNDRLPLVEAKLKSLL